VQSAADTTDLSPELDVERVDLLVRLLHHGGVVGDRVIVAVPNGEEVLVMVGSPL